MKNEKARSTKNARTGQRKEEDKHFFVRDYKNKGNNPDAVSTRLSEARFAAPFSMKEMHAVQKQYLESRNKLMHCIERPEALGDFLADVIATAHAKSGDSHAEQVNGGVSMYTGALHEHGYNQKFYSDFEKTVIDLLGDDGILVWIIAGTQDEYLVKRRAKAAAKAFEALRTKNKSKAIRHFIAFCGAHPPTDRVDQPNEAIRLEAEFRREAAQQLDIGSDNAFAGPSIKLQKAFIDDILPYVLIEESKSQNTHENIEQAMAMFFSDDIEKRASPTQPENVSRAVHGHLRKYGVIIVSNDFHLIRLGRDFRTHRHSSDMPKQEAANKLRFAALFLLGSEYFNVRETLPCLKRSPDFAKRFPFEALSDFFRSNYFLSDAAYLHGTPPANAMLPSGANSIPLVDSFVIPAIPDSKPLKLDEVEFIFRFNRLVFHPVAHSSLADAIEQRLLRFDKHGGEPQEETNLRIVQRLGGRFSQPTVRLSGVPRLVKDNSGKLKVLLDLATNYEGISLVSQLGLLKRLDPSILAATSKHQLLSLFTSVLYAFKKEKAYFILLRKRTPDRYVFANAWQASIEGPIYKDDFGGGELFDVRKTVLRLLKKEYITQLRPDHVQQELRGWEDRDPKKRTWNQHFFLTGMSHSAKHGQSYLHGVLIGPKLNNESPMTDIPNQLVGEPAEVPLNCKGLMSFFERQQSDLRILPCTIISILYALDKLVNSQECHKFLTVFSQHYGSRSAPIFEMHNSQLTSK